MQVLVFESCDDGNREAGRGPQPYEVVPGVWALELHKRTATGLDSRSLIHSDPGARFFENNNDSAKIIRD